MGNFINYRITGEAYNLLQNDYKWKIFLKEASFVVTPGSNANHFIPMYIK